MADAMTRPLVSVVMSLYNSERYLKEAIDSVLAQTLADFELIIIDDGSVDGGADIVRSYEDSRIRFFAQSNAGLPAALNRAISEAKSNLIARMDPDDICLPERLMKQFEYLTQHPEVVLVGSAATCIDTFGNDLADIQMKPYLPVGEHILPESPCIHPSAMFRRSVYEKAGRYPERMRFGGEDAVLFNKMIMLGAAANLPLPLIRYRLSHSSMSHKSREFNRLLREVVCKEVMGELVNKAEWQALAEAYRAPGGGKYGYHLYVAKLFLRYGGMEGMAREHLLQVLKSAPFSRHAWICLISSYIPHPWRLGLLSLWKRLRR